MHHCIFVDGVDLHINQWRNGYILRNRRSSSCVRDNNDETALIMSSLSSFPSSLSNVNNFKPAKQKMRFSLPAAICLPKLNPWNLCLRRPKSPRNCSIVHPSTQVRGVECQQFIGPSGMFYSGQHEQRNRTTDQPDNENRRLDEICLVVSMIHPCGTIR